MAASARPLTDVDFCSGSRIEELNKLLEELERRESSAVKVKDVLQSCVQAKDYIFSLIGHIHPLPSPNSLLLLSGGLCSGFLDVSPIDLGSPTPFFSPPISYTLLVPILHLPSSEPLIQCAPCHYQLPLSLWDPSHPHFQPTTPYVTPHMVSLWFLPSLLSVVSSIPTSMSPLSLEKAESWGNCASLLLSTPAGLLIRFDIVPVVKVQGWPPGAQYVDDIGTDDDGTTRLFHLLPWGPEGQWRVGFPGIELFMRRCLPVALSRVLRASMAVLRHALQEKGAPGPYVVWVTLLQACARLPQGYLCREQNAALCFLGLLEELTHSFLQGSCPNPFLPGCDLLRGNPIGPYLARRVSGVRAQPVLHLREVVRNAKEAVKGGEKDEKEEREDKGSTCYPS
ncbi:transmembrane protein 102 [Pelobates fuscus]|uniref:transmembrane protein 102 n=1 Tax=Pelobates fuscus TaxID=191477 RepID=UPI002FE42CAA